MYRKSVITRQLERKRKRCAAMRAAKDRKRITEAPALVECGGLLTWGALGNHDIRLLAYPDGRQVAVVVDGAHKRPRTLRGVWRVIGEMVWRGMQKGGMTHVGKTNQG
jgi:hypothetical protein